MKKIKIKMKLKGFTLIELLVVIAIIGVLAIAAIPRLLSAIDKAKTATAQSDISALNAAIRSYCIDKPDNLYPISASEADISTALTDITPKYMSALPKGPYESDGTNAYKYTSDGFSYTLSVFLKGSNYTLKYFSSINSFTEIY